jgi:hypothetical protein
MVIGLQSCGPVYGGNGKQMHVASIPATSLIIIPQEGGGGGLHTYVENEHRTTLSEFKGRAQGLVTESMVEGLSENEHRTTLSGYQTLTQQNPW